MCGHHHILTIINVKMESDSNDLCTVTNESHAILRQSHPAWIRCKHCREYLTEVIDLTNTSPRQCSLPTRSNLSESSSVQTSTQSVGLFAAMRTAKQARSDSIESTKMVKKSSSITINLVLLGAYMVNISFGGLSVSKYTKVLVLRRYYGHQVLLDEVFNDYEELVQFLLRTTKTGKEWIQKSWRICAGYSTGNGCNITELNGDLSEVVHVRALAGLINQGGKLEKSSVTIHLVHVIEEDEEETKEKKRDEKGTHAVEGVQDQVKHVQTKTKTRTKSKKQGQEKVDEVEQELEGTSKKKGKVALKVPFEMDTRKTTRKRSRTELSEDWIDGERVEKQIVVRDEDVTDEDEDLLSPTDL